MLPTAPPAPHLAGNRTCFDLDPENQIRVQNRPRQPPTKTSGTGFLGSYRYFLQTLFGNSVPECQQRFPLAGASSAGARHPDNPAEGRQARQCCFLCLEDNVIGSFAVQVTCSRPNEKYKDPWFWILDDSQTQHWKKICEIDRAIVRNLGSVAFGYQSSWWRWMPFYGVTDVREMKFRFRSAVASDERFPITVEPINVAKVREDADRVIDQGMAYENPDIDEYMCMPDYHHLEKCPHYKGYYEDECIATPVNEAKMCKKRLYMLPQLRDCARNPKSLSEIDFLAGMAQDTSIYHVAGKGLVQDPANKDRTLELPRQDKQYSSSDEYEFRGLQVTYGWQTDLIEKRVPLYMFRRCMAPGMLWCCVVVYGMVTKNWATGFALGLLIAKAVPPTVLEKK